MSSIPPPPRQERTVQNRALLTHDLHPRTVSAGLPEQTLLLDADLSPHQVLFDNFAASAPQTEAPCSARGYLRFNAGTEAACRRSQPPQWMQPACATGQTIRRKMLQREDKQRGDKFGETDEMIRALAGDFAGV